MINKEFDQYESERKRVVAETNSRIIPPFSFEHYKKSELEREELRKAKYTWKARTKQ